MGIECKQEVIVMNKYILKNGIILDGSEHMKPYKANILVNNGIIEEISSQMEKVLQSAQKSI